MKSTSRTPSSGNFSQMLHGSAVGHRHTSRLRSRADVADQLGRAEVDRAGLPSRADGLVALTSTRSTFMSLVHADSGRRRAAEFSTR